MIAFSQSVDTHRLLLLSGFGRLGPTPSLAAVIREAARRDLRIPTGR